MVVSLDHNDHRLGLALITRVAAEKKKRRKEEKKKRNAYLDPIPLGRASDTPGRKDLVKDTTQMSGRVGTPYGHNTVGT